MTPRREFHPLQAVEIADAFGAEGVEYLFIGKGGAILLGFPGTTQDIDVFVARGRPAPACAPRGARSHRTSAEPVRR